MRASPRFYLLVGIPGSGKSTYARRHLGQALRLSLDDLRLMLTGVAYDSRYESIVIGVGHAALDYMLSRAATWQRDILLDATNATRERRKHYLQLAERHGLPTVAVFLDCPLEMALARDRARPGGVGDEVVTRYFAQLQPPTAEEGFAELIHVTDCGA
ncbi:MAG: AAA family ATPase [Chloroflexi bacterium]|nr:AAA family ATPase [Chloroflexota bacterium]MCL5109449.1 AAA family ATPase [Chloroflexota bacterium]